MTDRRIEGASVGSAAEWVTAIGEIARSVFVELEVLVPVAFVLRRLDPVLGWEADVCQAGLEEDADEDVPLVNPLGQAITLLEQMPPAPALAAVVFFETKSRAVACAARTPGRIWYARAEILAEGLGPFVEQLVDGEQPVDDPSGQLEPIRLGGRVFDALRTLPMAPQTSN